MTSQEFTIWLKGFTEGVHEYNITPKQWDLLKEKLGQVIGDDNKFVETPGMFQVHPEKPYPGVPIGQGGWGTPNHDLVERYPWGGHKIWGGAGTAGPPIDCSTTSRSSGYIAPVSQSIPPSTITTGSNSTETVTYYPAYTNISYTTGSGVGFGTITTTPGTTGYVTVGNPEAMIGFNNTTGTAFNPQSGSWHYTTSGGPTWYSINKIENDSREK